MQHHGKEGGNVVARMTSREELLQRIVARRMPGYVVRPRSERHGRPETPAPSQFRTVEEMRARYARAESK